MSTWTLKEVRALSEKHGGGNKCCKAKWLATGDVEKYRPKPGDSLDKYKNFVRMAYEEKMFMAKDEETPEEKEAEEEAKEEAAAEAAEIKEEEEEMFQVEKPSKKPAKKPVVVDDEDFDEEEEKPKKKVVKKVAKKTAGGRKPRLIFSVMHMKVMLGVRGGESGYRIR